MNEVLSSKLHYVICPPIITCIKVKKDVMKQYYVDKGLAMHLVIRGCYETDFKIIYIDKNMRVNFFSINKVKKEEN